MGAVAGAIGGRTSRIPPASTVEVCGYYWHFVDVVWVAMFTTIYLLR
jgi:heme/copper-type cytochrome/quinol oxidase subunit 3